MIVQNYRTESYWLDSKLPRRFISQTEAKKLASGTSNKSPTNNSQPFARLSIGFLRELCQKQAEGGLIT